ncbi:TIGR02530 family flagellar biosynthesis protein [Selenihalanaerobacter shriftii]|uniref:Flagellar operon protein n=1 Tax=Selenihalanaerobacter shriftii TaxID=142842 RepID=A0A1T4MBM7_9FIRM|nr:TIGR02530 family flagellar biosynthesis protein [Selenihalanaerobacter shriftii]SJZ64281.1 flagellar operon protein [Selenihalanaerobacter shriftii]
MDNRIYSKRPIGPLQKPQQKQNNQVNKKQKKGSFNEIFQKELEHKTEIKFSGHAKKRLNARNINLTNNDLKKLEKAVTKAEDKGSKESLILVNKVGFVVSVENKTVITAVDNQSMKENVFTNIDSAVVMD